MAEKIKNIWVVTIQKNPDNEDEFEIMGIFEKKQDAASICKDIRYCIFEMPFNKELKYKTFYPEKFDRPNTRESKNG